MKVHPRRDDGLRVRQALDEAAAWRQENLLRAGFDPELAAAVAEDRRFDLHAVLQLVDRGCPPVLAVQILAPVPSEARG